MSAGFLLHSHALLVLLRRNDIARRKFLEVVPSSRYYLLAGTNMAVSMGETGALRSHVHLGRNDIAFKGLLASPITTVEACY